MTGQPTVLPAVAMSVLLPAQPGATAVLVARPGSPVLHLALTTRTGLTPGGRLRRGRRPVCARPARSWPTTPIDGRPLCRRCTAKVLGAGADLRGVVVPVELLAATLATAWDAVTVDAAAALVVRTSGAIFALSPKVRDARDRLVRTGLAPAPRRHVLQPYVSRRAG